MKKIKKICKDCGEPRYIYALGRCPFCYTNYKRATKPPKPIAKMSKKMTALNAKYLKRRAIFLEKNNICIAKLDGCTWWATDVHHGRGRGAHFFLNELTWKPLCRNCHTFAETHPEEAKRLDLSRSRLY